MKKYILILVTLVILTGCGLSKKEKIFKKYALDYYENYMQDIDMDNYQITLKMLKNSNNKKKTNYDLDKLKKCHDDSYVNISIENNKNKYEFKLNCK